MSELPPDERPARRVRYAGKNPRRFQDKYKELDPARFPGDVAKALAAGKTPAGAHRPIMVGEVLDALAPRPGEIAVDCTLGYGGHAGAILAALAPGGRLYGLDVDPIELPRTERRLREAGFGPELFQARQANFAGLPKLLAAESLGAVDLVLADLGVSSMQLDDPERGFTFKADGPLDLRLNPARGQSAAALLAKIDAPRLAALLAENADEPQAELLAAAILAAQRVAPIARTRQLADAIRAALARPGERLATVDAADTQRRVFQALRIEVNDEFGALDALLRVLPGCLKPGGRAAIMSFHSGEDRRVKKAFQAGLREGAYSAVSDAPIRASGEERRANPRSASAKLRWAIRAR